jgi:uncharacterized protein DUF4242
VVEFYVARADAGSVAERAKDLHRAVEQVSQQGTPVRYLRSLYVPEDETCFFLLDAPSADTVREAAQRAGLPFERIAEAQDEEWRE